MHIPDGLLSGPVSLASAALSLAGISAAAVRVRADRSSRAVALLGVTAAFVFAAQMLNFPVAGGTSGHLIGGVLAAVLVGPSAAVIVMTAVLMLQCLMFGDGGLLALGANVLNMGIVHPLVGFGIYRVLTATPSGDRRLGGPRRIGAIAFASWAATVLTSATCAGELALSRVTSPAIVLPAMVGSHLLIGAGEAVITALVVSTVLRLRPDLLDTTRAQEIPRRSSAVVLGLSTSVAIGVFVSPFACSWPDGLERVVERLGIQPAHMRVSLPAPLPDYAVPGLKGALKTSVAALVGTVTVFALCFGLGLWLAPRGQKQPGEALTTP